MTIGANTVNEGRAAPRRGARRDAIANPLAVLARDRTKFLQFLLKRLPSEAEAEDLLQQALVRAAEKIETLRDPECARAWFYRLLRRMVADTRAREALRTRRLDLLRADLDEATPEEIVTCACSLGLLERVRPEYATVLRRIDLDEEPIVEVARSLGVTTNNATVRLHRARGALRKLLQDACGTDSVKACADCACDEMREPPTTQ